MRKFLLAASASAFIFGLSACAAATPTPAISTAPAKTAGASPPPTATSSPMVTVTATPAPSVSPTAMAAKSCDVANLKSDLSRNDGAAGTNYFDVSLENVGSSACTLKGYPRVLAVTGKGSNTQAVSQVGEDAGHSYWDYRAQAGEEGSRDNPLVTIEPGKKAYFQLSYPSIYNYATGELRDDPYQQTYDGKCGGAIAVKGFLTILPGAKSKVEGGPISGVFVDDPTGPIPICDSFKGPYVQVSEFVSNPTTG